MKMEHGAKKMQNLYPLVIFAGLLLGAIYYLYPGEMFFKLLGALGAAAAVLYNPVWGLYLLAFTLPFLPDLSLLLLAGLIGASFLIRRIWRGKFTLEDITVEPALVLFIIAAAVFTLTSVTPAGSMRELGIYYVSFLVIFVLINGIEKKNQLYIFVLLALLAALIVSLYGIYQFAVGVPAEGGWVDSANNPMLTTRVYSFFGNPNILAEYLLMLIPFGLALAFSVKDRLKSILLLGVTGVLTLTLLLTFTRGAWVGLAAALVLFAFLKDRRILVVLLILAVVGAALAPPVVLQRAASIVNIQDTSNSYRLMVWQEALHIARDFWTRGVGFGHKAFMEVYPFYMLTRVKTPYHVHNTYLQLLVETGVVGLLIFIWLLAGTIKRGLKSFSSVRDRFLRHMLIAALSSAFGLAVHALGEHVLYMPKIIILFWLVAGLIFLCRRLGVFVEEPPDFLLQAPAVEEVRD